MLYSDNQFLFGCLDSASSFLSFARSLPQYLLHSIEVVDLSAHDVKNFAYAALHLHHELVVLKNLPRLKTLRLCIIVVEPESIAGVDSKLNDSGSSVLQAFERPIAGMRALRRFEIHLQHYCYGVADACWTTLNFPMRKFDIVRKEGVYDKMVEYLPGQQTESGKEA